MNASEFTPAEVAMFDQLAACANDTLDSEIAVLRQAIAVDGAELAIAHAATDYRDVGSVPALAMSYAWALRRIIEMQDGQR